MATRNTLKLETKGLEQIITQLEGIGGDVKQAVTDALEQAAETIEFDTKEAMRFENLPAKGKFSSGKGDYRQGKTYKTIIEGSKAVWNGTTAEIAVGFDYSLPGAGGILITGRGTPHQEPVKPLQNIYKKKAYMAKIQADMAEVVNGYITEKMGG